MSPATPTTSSRERHELPPKEPHPYHLCTIGPARIDPLQQLGIVPDHALSYWWGGVRFLTSTGASSTATMARCARSLAAGLDEIAREGDRPGGCSPRPWRPRSRRTLRRIYSTGTRTGVSHQGRSEDPFRTSSMLRATVIASSGRGTAARPTNRLGRFKQGTGLPDPSRPHDRSLRSPPTDHTVSPVRQ